MVYNGFNELPRVYAFILNYYLPILTSAHGTIHLTAMLRIKSHPKSNSEREKATRFEN